MLENCENASGTRGGNRLRKLTLVGAVALPGLFILCAVVSLIMPPLVSVQGGATYKYGSVRAGDRVLHTFHLINENYFPVRIEIAPTGCSCTEARLSQTTIMGRGNADVLISINASGHGKKVEGLKVISQSTFRRAETWMFVQFSVVSDKSAHLSNTRKLPINRFLQ
jgi:hypothetical protein